MTVLSLAASADEGSKPCSSSGQSHPCWGAPGKLPVHHLISILGSFSPSCCFVFISQNPDAPETSAKLHSTQQPGEDLGNRFVYVLCGCASTMHNYTVLLFGKCHLVFIFFHSIIHHLHPHRFTLQLPFCFQDNFSYTVF